MDYEIYKKVGNRKFFNGEWGWTLVLKEEGEVRFDGDYTDEEIEEGLDWVPYKKFVFKNDDGMYNTEFYVGEMIQYGLNRVSKYHHDGVEKYSIEDFYDVVDVEMFSKESLQSEMSTSV